MKTLLVLKEMLHYRGRDEMPDATLFGINKWQKWKCLSYQLLEKDFQIAYATCYDLTFKSGTRNSPLVVPKLSEKVPVLFHFHGYMTGLADMLPIAGWVSQANGCPVSLATGW